MVLRDLPLFLFREGLPVCPMLTASDAHHSGCWDLPQAASLGLPGRSKSWGHGCRRAGIYTSGSGRGSPRRTGTWARGGRGTNQRTWVNPKQRA